MIYAAIRFERTRVEELPRELYCRSQASLLFGSADRNLEPVAMARIADLLPCELAALAFLVQTFLSGNWWSACCSMQRGAGWGALGGGRWPSWADSLSVAGHSSGGPTTASRPPKRRGLRLRPRFLKEGRGGAQDPGLSKLERPGDGAFTYSLPRRAEVPPHRGQEAVPPVCENSRAAVVPSRFQSPGGTIRGGWKPRHY